MMATAPATAYLQTPLQAPPPLQDPKLEQLRAMFPEIEADCLEAMLSFHAGDVEAAVMAILDVPADAPPSQEDADASVARAMQTEIDEELARAVQKQMEDEDAARRQQEPGVRAAAAVESAAAKAKALMQRAMRPLSARGRSGTHATRLLDAPEASDSANFDFSPLQLPTYTPPAAMAPPAEPAAADATQAEPSLDLSSEPSSASPGGDRYSARLGRARAANQLSQRSLSRLPASEEASPPAAAAPASVHVPVGELI